MRKRLIISNYKEDTTWINQIDKSVIEETIVYRKYNQDNLSNYLDYKQTDASNINLANIGREAHTYLIHIVKNYDNLYDIEIFCQANPFEHCYDFLERIHNIDKNLSFEQFGHIEKIVSKDEIKKSVCEFNFKYLNNLIDKDPTWSRANFFHIDSIHLDLFGQDMPDKSIMKPYAQFAVSKNCIRSHSFETYNRLLKYFNDNVNYNVMAWHMEYFWHLLFRESIDLEYNSKNNIFKL